MNGDGSLTRDEMNSLLSSCLVRVPPDEDPDEGIKELQDICMKKLDKDKDGKINLNDYRLSVTQDELLLELFGVCLPDDRIRDAFLATFSDV